jgi:alanine racemase
MTRTWADVDLGAIRHNVEALRAVAAPAQLCAVVKADGYGHGAVPAAQAALAGGATWLAVAQVDEAAELRGAGIDAPVLLLAEPGADELHEAVSLGLDVAAYRVETISALAALGRAENPVPIHLKVDTGMHRVGAAPADAPALAKAVADAPELVLAALWTHLAVADEPDDRYTVDQITRFETVAEQLAASGIQPRLHHAANSAGTIWHPSTRFDLVRCGIAIYGISPAPGLAAAVPLQPALRWSTEVSFVKPLAAGQRVSYGLRHRAVRDTKIATLPVGYADGVRRDSGLRGQQVIIGGRRHPIVGTVTMDQLLVDVGPQSDVQVGDEAVLVGPQGEEHITADEWALRAGTIGYEIVCAVGSRVERRYVD